MPRAASGAITITDITDGTSPVSAILTNENHTFPAASSTGSVSTNDRNAFTSSVLFYVGTELATYATSLAGTGNTFTIGTIASDNTAWTTAISATGVITFDAIPTGTTEAARSTILYLPISYRTGSVDRPLYSINTQLNGAVSAGSATEVTVDSTDGFPPQGEVSFGSNTFTYTSVTATTFVGASQTLAATADNTAVTGVGFLTISLTKAIEGTGGAIVILTPNKQTFSVDSAGTESPSNQTDVTMRVDTQGIVGTVTVEKSINGAAYSTLVQGNGADQARKIDVDGVVDTMLNGAITAGNHTTVTVDSTVGFPETGVIVIESDTFIYTSKTDTVFTGDSQALVGHADNTVVSAQDLEGTIVISFENFSDSQTLSVRTTGSSGGSDTVSIARISQGEDGASAVLVVIESSDDTVFKNSAGADKTITARVYDAANGTEIAPHTLTNGSTAAGATTMTVDSTLGFPSSGTLIVGSDVFTYTGTTATTFTGIPATGGNAIGGTIANDTLVSVNGSVNVTFSWFLGDATGNAVLTTTTANRAVDDSGTAATSQTLIAGGTSSFHQIIVGDEDVMTTQQYTCLVSVADA